SLRPLGYAALASVDYSVEYSLPSGFRIFAPVRVSNVRSRPDYAFPSGFRTHHYRTSDRCGKGLPPARSEVASEADAPGDRRGRARPAIRLPSPAPTEALMTTARRHAQRHRPDGWAPRSFGLPSS